jgi:hypothetical protein
MLVLLSALALVYQATPAPAAQVGRWHALATTSAGFITDGESYAAWNPTASSPMVLYAASTGQTREFPGCFAGGSASEYEPDQGAAGMLLIGCAGHPYLLSAKTGSLRPLPRPAGTLWRRLGSHYVEGEAEPASCGLATSALGSEARCRALFDIATGAISYSREDRVPDLSRPGAPEVCKALRTRLLYSMNHGDFAAFAYGPEWLFTAASEGSRIRLRGCQNRVTSIPSGGYPEDFCFGAGILTWTVARSGPSARSEEESGPHAKKRLLNGRVGEYDVTRHRTASFAAPRSHLNDDGSHYYGVFGYAAHAGRNIFWIAATKTNSHFVETATIYVLRSGP